MRKWIWNNHRYIIALVFVLLISCIIFTDPTVSHYLKYVDHDRNIIKQINAYQHLPNGTTEVWYDGGGLDIEGTWYFNQPGRYYELWRDNDSNVWHVSPY